MTADLKLLADLRRASEECADQHGHYRDLMNSAADALEECSRYVSQPAAQTAVRMAIQALLDIQERAPGTRAFFDYEAFIAEQLMPSLTCEGEQS